MTHSSRRRHLAAVITAGILVGVMPVQAADDGWSLVPHLGVSLLGDQSAGIAGTTDIVDGELDIAVDPGFSAGFGLRYDYRDSCWSSELSWEYRSNESETTTADGTVLPDGNYASSILSMNGRYALNEGNRWTPWLGVGLSWVQEVDLDSEDADGERSFSDSGAFGVQLMAGMDYDLSDRLYLSSELRYVELSGLDLDEEGGGGRVTDIDYQPLALSLGVGIRF